MSSIDPTFSGSIFRKDHPMVLAQNRQLATMVPVALAYNASGYVAGRVLGRNSVSGQYANYDNGASSGLDTAVGVLFESVDVTEFESSTGTIHARMIVGGELYESKLLGLDANAKTDLGSRSIVDASNTTILKF